MMSVANVLERIPTEFVAILVCITAAWGFLRLPTNQAASSVLMPLLVDFAVVYIVATKFSGLFIHPEEIGGLSIWTVLAQAPSSGWFVGLSASTLLLLVRLHRTLTEDKMILQRLTNTALFSLCVWFTVRLFADHDEFIIRDVALGVVAACLLILSLRNGKEFAPYTHRLWIAWSASLLLSSTFVPLIDKWALFSPVQWCGILILIAGLASEAMLDIRRRKRSVRQNPHP